VNQQTKRMTLNKQEIYATADKIYYDYPQLSPMHEIQGNCLLAQT